MGDVSLSTVGYCLNEGEMKACAKVSVYAADTSLGRSGSQLTHGHVGEGKSMLRMNKLLISN